LDFYWKHVGPALFIYILLDIVNFFVNHGPLFWICFTLISLAYAMFLGLVHEWYRMEREA